jgi:TolA-binding protein
MFSAGRRQRKARWFAWAGLACGLGAGLAAASADEIVTQSQTYRGKVKSANREGIIIEINLAGGQSVITVPRNLVLKVWVTQPASVSNGIAAYEKGNFKEAQADLGKTFQQYPGLDVGWAVTSLLYFARASLAVADLTKAQQGFGLFATNYSEHALGPEGQAGLLEVELARKNYEAALEGFRKLAEGFDKQLKPTKVESACAARVYLGIGKCLEGLAKPAEALPAYLALVALYPVEPFYPEALFRGAAIYRVLGQNEQAEVRLQALLNEYATSEWGLKAAEEKKKIAARLETKPGSDKSQP